jgi:hypothetical protein
LDLFNEYNEKFGDKPSEEQINAALISELNKRPKEVLVEMLADLTFLVGEGDPNAEFLKISDELAAELNKKEEEDAKAKLESKNSQTGT